RHFPLGERMRRLSCDFVRLRLLFDRVLRFLAYQIDRAIPRNRHHPRDGGGYSRVELPGTAPDLDVGLLDDLLRQIGSAQDTQHHPIEFPTGCRVEPFKRGLVAAADGGEEPDEFGWRQHGATTPCPVSGPRSTSRLSPPDTGSVERRNYAPGGG